MNQKQSIEWLPVKGYEHLYLVSEYGDLKSKERTINAKLNSFATKKEKILKKSKSNGYVRYALIKEDGSKKSIFAHRLVAESFLKNNFNFETVDHLDENKLNNHFTNLEWTTRSDNAKRWKSKRSFSGENNTNSILTQKDIDHIRCEFDRLNKRNKRSEKRDIITKIHSGYGVSRSCINKALSKTNWSLS